MPHRNGSHRARGKLAKDFKEQVRETLSEARGDFHVIRCVRICVGEIGGVEI